MLKQLSANSVHFPDLSIKGFRGIKDLSISRLGRVTLITGKNNTGKSSILEALRLHVENAAPYTIYSILKYREESNRFADEEARSADAEDMFPVSTLFHGFPKLSDDFAPIAISTSGKLHPMKLTMHVEWFTEEDDPEGFTTLSPLEDASLEELEIVPALVTETEERRQVRRFASFSRFARQSRPRPRPHDRVRMPCIPVSPYGGGGTDMLGPLWDGIALTDLEKHLVEALRIIDPRISAVSMVGDDTPRRSRTAIARADNILRPIQLRSFGDGVNRLFGIVLSLVNAGEGLLLIDEFENGLHYSVQLDAWRMIFRLARDLDVQVFATSHSWDAIEAFQLAATETPEDGVLVRLTRRGDNIIPTVCLYVLPEEAITLSPWCSVLRRRTSCRNARQNRGALTWLSGYYWWKAVTTNTS